jgi:hypothetical protein
MSDPDDDDDELDGMCDLDFDNGPEVTDDEAPYVVLFATDLDCDKHVRDWTELERHAHAWHVLFDEPVS